jgi:hypothetical protein
MTAIGAHGATLVENAICAASEENLLLARSLIQEGDEKALQVLFQKGLIRNLYGVEITRISETYDEYGIVMIRVVGTVDFYYTRVGNIFKSKAEIQAEEEQAEAAELAREAEFDRRAHQGGTPQ